MSLNTFLVLSLNAYNETLPGRTVCFVVQDRCLQFSAPPEFDDAPDTVHVDEESKATLSAVFCALERLEFYGISWKWDDNKIEIKADEMNTTVSNFIFISFYVLLF